MEEGATHEGMTTVLYNPFSCGINSSRTRNCI